MLVTVRGGGSLEQTETCCFTGHRPDKLPWGIRENDPRCADLKPAWPPPLEGGIRRGFPPFHLRHGPGPRPVLCRGRA